MGKIIFWLVIVFGALLVMRLLNVAKYGSRGNAKRGSESSGDSGSPSDSRSPRSGAASMVRCVECGVFLPRAEATDTPRGPTCGDARCPRPARRTAA